MSKCLKKELIPNYLTILRIVLIPLIIFFMVYNAPHGVDNNPLLYTFTFLDTVIYVRLYWFIAGLLFILASFTDWLDGYLARKYKWVSEWGKIWDPLADKILVNVVLILMGSQFKGMGQTIIFIPILMISRDIIIDGYRINAAKKNIIIPANIWGKLKTLSQMLGIIVLFFLFNSTPNVGWNKSICYYTFQNFLLYVALVLSMTSGIIYVKKINKMNHGKRK